MTGEDRPALFAFGTLMDPDVLALVRGVPLDDLRTEAARVDDRARRRVVDDHYPVLVEMPGERVEGLLIHGLDDHAIERIRFFEGEEFALAPILVRDARGAEVDAVHFADTGRKAVADVPWSLEGWQADTKPDTLPRVRRYMACFGTMSVAEADAHW